MTDTGKGIPVKDRESIFLPYIQITDEPGNQSKGRGLGLAITKRIVEQFMGMLWVEPNEERGSKFIFTFEYEDPRDQRLHADSVGLEFSLEVLPANED